MMLSDLSTAPKDSFANRWLIGGFLRSFEWDGAPRILPGFAGVPFEVRPGDQVVVLLTGLPAAQFVGVSPDQ